MFWQRNCGAAFSRWREKEFQVACQAIEFTNFEIDRNEANFQRQVTTIKDHNGAKYEQHIGTVNKHKVF
jgi:hypothetical protein